MIYYKTEVQKFDAAFLESRPELKYKQNDFGGHEFTTTEGETTLYLSNDGKSAAVRIKEVENFVYSKGSKHTLITEGDFEQIASGFRDFDSK